MLPRTSPEPDFRDSEMTSIIIREELSPKRLR